jgi:hypothetical protein
MRVLAHGFWGVTHWVLDSIGRTTACILPGNRSQRDEEACAMTGGAVLGVIFGAIFGVMLSAQSHDVNSVVGASLGALVGACSGVIYGAFAQVMDDWINLWLDSGTPK